MEEIDYSKYYGRKFCRHCEVLLLEHQIHSRAFSVTAADDSQTKINKACCEVCGSEVAAVEHPLWWLTWMTIVFGGILCLGIYFLIQGLDPNLIHVEMFAYFFGFIVCLIVSGIGLAYNITIRKHDKQTIKNIALKA
jgi:hypothetical protein